MRRASFVRPVLAVGVLIALGAAVLPAGATGLPPVAAGRAPAAGRAAAATGRPAVAATRPTTGLRLLPVGTLNRGADTFTPAAYGAVGDGVHDDTVALQEALDAATATHPLVLPVGKVYAHSAVLHIRVAGERIFGRATLLATNEQASSVWIEADGVLLNGPTLATRSTTQRWSAWEQMGLRLDGTSGTIVRDVTVTGSAAAGIYVGGSDHFLLDHDTVRGTRADGIHMTGGSQDGQVVDPTTIGTGDDGIAVVSYGSDAQPCHDITVTGAHVEGTTGGRGMSVVGGTAITYTGFSVDASDAAGIYVAAEGAPYYTYAPIDVTISGGTVTNANTDPTIDHGAVLVVGEESPQTPTDVTISHVLIDDTRSSASRDAGVISYAAPPVGVVMSSFTITGGPSSPYQGNAPATSYTTTGWMVDGVAMPSHIA